MTPCVGNVFGSCMYVCMYVCDWSIRVHFKCTNRFLRCGAILSMQCNQCGAISWLNPWVGNARMPVGRQGSIRINGMN